MKSNFYYSFFFLPLKKKEAISCFYAFCREIDDQIDRYEFSSTSLSKMAIVQEWREELNRTFQGSPRHLLTQKLYPIILQYHLSKVHFDEIINGMEMDVLNSSYQTFEELKLYCYRVASAVGLVLMEIFNDHSDASKELAIHLGIAFQLTNVLRDIFVDLLNGRIYLPEEDFHRFGYSKNDLKKKLINVEFSKLIQFEIDRAKNYYEKARSGLSVCKNEGKDAIEVMFKTYYQLLLRIEKNTWNLTRGPISVPLITKVLIAGKVWLNKHRISIDSKH